MYVNYNGYGWNHSPDRSGTEAPPIRGKIKAAFSVAKPTAMEELAAAAPLKVAQPAPAPAAKAAPKPKPARATKPQAVSTGKPSRPQGLAKARGGKADNLQQISGVGPKLERTLHGLGFYHFDQIAAWSRDEVDWVDEHLRFKGRIDRDEWIPQAKLLAAGDTEQFTKLYGTGGLKNRAGVSKSGSRTRRS